MYKRLKRRLRFLLYRLPGGWRKPAQRTYYKARKLFNFVFHNESVFYRGDTRGKARLPVSPCDIDASFRICLLIVEQDGRRGDAARSVQSAMQLGDAHARTALFCPDGRTPRTEKAGARPEVIPYRPGRLIDEINAYLQKSDATHFTLIHAGDTVSETLLFALSRAVVDCPDAALLYTDEDVLAWPDRRVRPNYKPDWSPDTLMSAPYTGQLTVYEKQYYLSSGGFSADFGDAFAYDFALRALTDHRKATHIRQILYHRRPNRHDKAIDQVPFIKAREAALSRTGTRATVQAIPKTPFCNVRYEVTDGYGVCAVIPSKDHPELAKQCIRSLREKRGSERLTIIVIDNGSNEENKLAYQQICETFDARYLYEPMPFNFARQCNSAAAATDEKLLLFINDDTELTTPGGIEILAGQACQAHTGAVGAKLLYPGGKYIQHTGVVMRNGQPTHLCINASDQAPVVLNANRMNRNFLAVTGACLMIEKEKFRRAGGFCEAFASSYNDVDLCMTLLEMGYHNVMRSDVTLIHYESVSRNARDADMNSDARALLCRRHPAYKDNDPYYSADIHTP